MKSYTFIITAALWIKRGEFCCCSSSSIIVKRNTFFVRRWGGWGEVWLGVGGGGEEGEREGEDGVGARHGGS